MFKLIGKNEIDANKDADKVMEIETLLAKASSTRVERRDPVKNYNKMSFDSLKSITPGIDWNLYFKGLGIDTPTEFDVNQPRFIKEVSALLLRCTTCRSETLFRWHLTQRYCKLFKLRFCK